MSDFKITNPAAPKMDPETLLRKYLTQMNELQLSRQLPPCVFIIQTPGEPIVTKNFESAHHALGLLGLAVFTVADKLEAAERQEPTVEP